MAFSSTHYCKVGPEENLIFGLRFLVYHFSNFILLYVAGHVFALIIQILLLFQGPDSFHSLYQVDADSMYPIDTVVVVRNQVFWTGCPAPTWP